MATLSNLDDEDELSDIAEFIKQKFPKKKKRHKNFLNVLNQQVLRTSVNPLLAHKGPLPVHFQIGGQLGNKFAERQTHLAKLAEKRAQEVAMNQALLNRVQASAAGQSAAISQSASNQSKMIDYLNSLGNWVNANAKDAITTKANTHGLRQTMELLYQHLNSSDSAELSGLAGEIKNAMDAADAVAATPNERTQILAANMDKTLQALPHNGQSSAAMINDLAAQAYKHAATGIAAKMAARFKSSDAFKKDYEEVMGASFAPLIHYDRPSGLMEAERVNARGQIIGPGGNLPADEHLQRGLITSADGLIAAGREIASRPDALNLASNEEIRQNLRSAQARSALAQHMQSSLAAMQEARTQDTHQSVLRAQNTAALGQVEPLSTGMPQAIQRVAGAIGQQQEQARGMEDAEPTEQQNAQFHQINQMDTDEVKQSQQQQQQPQPVQGTGSGGNVRNTMVQGQSVGQVRPREEAVQPADAPPTSRARTVNEPVVNVNVAEPPPEVVEVPDAHPDFDPDMID